MTPNGRQRGPAGAVRDSVNSCLSTVRWSRTAPARAGHGRARRHPSPHGPQCHRPYRTPEPGLRRLLTTIDSALPGTVPAMGSNECGVSGMLRHAGRVAALIGMMLVAHTPGADGAPSLTTPAFPQPALDGRSSESSIASTHFVAGARRQHAGTGRKRRIPRGEPRHPLWRSACCVQCARTGTSGWAHDGDRRSHLQRVVLLRVPPYAHRRPATRRAAEHLLRDRRRTGCGRLFRTGGDRRMVA